MQDFDLKRLLARLGGEWERLTLAAVAVLAAVCAWYLWSALAADRGAANGADRRDLPTAPRFRDNAFAFVTAPPQVAALRDKGLLAIPPGWRPPRNPQPRDPTPVAVVQPTPPTPTPPPPDVKPPPPEPPPRRTPQPRTIITYHGYLTGGSGTTVASVSRQRTGGADGKTERDNLFVAPGETIGGFTIKSIGPDELVLTTPDGEQRTVHKGQKLRLNQ